MENRLGEAGEKLIKSYEKCKLVAYMPTPDDKPTIGYGHTKGVKLGMVITKERAEELFWEDIAWAEDCVNDNVCFNLTQNQFDACVSLAFNIGATAFKNSTLVRLLDQGKVMDAANQFLRWNRQKGRVLAGLSNRRAKERHLFLTKDE